MSRAIEHEGKRCGRQDTGWQDVCELGEGGLDLCHDHLKASSVTTGYSGQAGREGGATLFRIHFLLCDWRLGSVRKGRENELPAEDELSPTPAPSPPRDPPSATSQCWVSTACVTF
ncbi:hypothetical protein MHYP_G00197900 [Metynnis hypsauchen]